MSFALVGVHARNAAIQAADKNAVQTARVEAVKLMVGGNDLGDIDAYRAAGVTSFHARLYTEEPAHDGGMTAAKFVQVFTPAIHRPTRPGRKQWRTQRGRRNSTPSAGARTMRGSAI